MMQRHSQHLVHRYFEHFHITQLKSSLVLRFGWLVNRRQEISFPVTTKPVEDSGGIYFSLLVSFAKPFKSCISLHTLNSKCVQGSIYEL